MSMYAAWLRSPAQFDPNSRATSGLVRDSIRSTSAPWYASARPQLGAAMAIDSSTTVTPSRTPNWPPPDGQRNAASLARPVSTGSAGVVALGPAPAQPALHELVEVAVEDGGDVARLDVGAQVLDHLVRLQHVGADLAAPPDLGLLAADGVELGLAAPPRPWPRTSPSADPAPSPGSGAGCAPPASWRRGRSARGSGAPPTTSC